MSFPQKRESRKVTNKNDMYQSEILEYLKSDSDLNLEQKDTVAVVNVNDLSIIDLIYNWVHNIYLVTNEKEFEKNVKKDYPKVILLDGNEEDTRIRDKEIDYIFLDSNVDNFNIIKSRKEFKRILRNYYSDIVIFENTGEVLDNDTLTELYAGSWYEKKEFDNQTDSKVVLYLNPLGLNEEDFKTPEIINFFDSCQKYCQAIENYKNYSLVNFLSEIQKCLFNYYYAGFFIPLTCGSENVSKEYEENTDKDINKFFEMSNNLVAYLGEHNIYWSNFDPYPDDNDTQTTEHSLANDLAEIYEDIKVNMNAFSNGTIYDKQETLWQCKFDWSGHTGDHLTFAVRAIHWKLQFLVD